MSGYLFCTIETYPPAEAPVEETEADRRAREAARLEIPPSRPGEDPPTYGDEGGGNLLPERSFEEARRPTFLQRLVGGFKS